MRLVGAIGAVRLAVRGATISDSWVRSVTRWCDRRDASGFVGAVRSVRCEWVRRQSGVSGFENDGETISPVVRRSLYSLFFLSMSLSSRVVRKWRDDLDDR